MTYVVPKSNPKIILGALTLRFGGVFTWFVFFFLAAAGVPEVAAPEVAAPEVAEATARPLLAEGLAL